MTEAEARTRIERLVAASASPTLDVNEIDDLVEDAARPDADGRVRGDAGWVPTWNLYAAAAEGWRWKAAKASEFFAFAADGTNTSRNQIWEHCIAQSTFYDTQAITAGGSGAYTIQVTGMAPVPAPEPFQ